MLGSGFDTSSCEEKFIEVPKDFYPIEEGDKIIDVSLGKKWMCVVTEKGKVWGSGYVYYRYIGNTYRWNEQNNEDYPY